MCMPYAYALCVCLTCVPYMYAVYVCLMCAGNRSTHRDGDDARADALQLRVVCLVCMPYMYALHVCLMYMPDM